MKNILYLILLISANGYSQAGRVGINTTTPNSTLEITKSSSAQPSDPQGILIPRLEGDEIQAMTMGANQNGMLVFATKKPNTPILRTNLILDQGLYYYLFSADKWYNVNQFNNSLNSALYSVNYSDSYVGVSHTTGGGGSPDFNNPSQISYLLFYSDAGSVTSVFNPSPYVTTRTADPNQGVKFLKSGVYNVTVQFSFVYARDVAGDGASNPNLPDRLGSQLTFNMNPLFLTSPPGSYISNLSHNIDTKNIRLGSGQQRVSGIAVGNIIVQQDNVVEFIPEIWTSGYWLSSEELIFNSGGNNRTGTLNIHILRTSDL